MPLLRLTALLICLLLLLSACSTRQRTDVLGGATAQRLVTYSVEKLLNDLPRDELKVLEGKSLLLRSHFIEDYKMTDYADRLLRLKLEQHYHVNWVVDSDDADFEMDYFFNAMGTDSDSFGFALPLLSLGGSSEGSQINLLSLNMFHGISEGYFFLRDNIHDTLQEFPRQATRVRTDKVATPIISFPINQLD